MKLMIISSSQRAESQTAKVAQFIAEHAPEHGFSAQHVELHCLNLPFFNGDGQQMEQHAEWQPLVDQLRDADALVLATPEWNGSASPMLRNLLMALPGSIVEHKPALLVSVVAGLNGVYPITELRGHAFKNNRIVPIPEHLIVRYAPEVFNGLECKGESDRVARERLQNSLSMLASYAKALVAVQQQYRANDWHPSGM